MNCGGRLLRYSYNSIEMGKSFHGKEFSILFSLVEEHGFGMQWRPIRMLRLFLGRCSIVIVGFFSSQLNNN